jgi:type II secretory pathway pseudopilin PulG
MRELLAVITVLCVVMALIMPAIQSAREAQRRNRCQSNLKMLGLALLNYENKYMRLPPISSNVDLVADIPGDATATTPGSRASEGSSASSGAGYSWMVRILPDIEESTLYMAIVNDSSKFSLPAFSPQNVVGGVGTSSPHAATQQISIYVCPAFSGEPVLDSSPRTVGSANKPETGAIPSQYTGKFATANSAQGIAITNYNAMLGTHIDPTSKLASDPNNGGMMFRGTSFYRTSKSLVLPITASTWMTPGKSPILKPPVSSSSAISIFTTRGSVLQVCPIA